MSERIEDGAQQLLEEYPTYSAVVGIKSFFGEPYQVGDKTLVPLLSMRFEGGPAGASSVKPVAIIRIEGTKVSIRSVPNRLPIVLASLVLGGWNAYWLLKTVREWLRNR